MTRSFKRFNNARQETIDLLWGKSERRRTKETEMKGRWKFLPFDLVFIILSCNEIRFVDIGRSSKKVFNSLIPDITEFQLNV